MIILLNAVMRLVVSGIRFTANLQRGWNQMCPTYAGYYAYPEEKTNQNG